MNVEINYMKIPKMILFDYGQTLIAEQKFDGVKRTERLSYSMLQEISIICRQSRCRLKQMKSIRNSGDLILKKDTYFR